MNKLDFAAINQALDPQTVVPKWLPHGSKNGKEWISANPTRADRRAGSFTVNLNEGNWKDFATGDGGADLVSLYAYLFCGGDQGAAARELAQNHGVKIGDPVTREQAANVHKLEDAKPVPVFPVPDDAAAPKFWHPKFGTASSVWSYNDKDGRVLMHVCRFDPEGERKQVLPYTFCTNPNGTTGWRWRGITRPAKVPLYGLDLLAASPDADVIIVEGEKATDAGRRLLAASGAVVASWLGGIENADRANIKALAGRRVVLWPDFDSQRERLTADEANAGMQPEDKPMLRLHEQPGMRAMMAIATALKGVAREIILVGYTVDGEFPHGWDLHDAEAQGWGVERVMQYMGQHSGDPWHIASAKPAPAPTPAAEPDKISEPAPKPANDNAPRLPFDATVNPFGWPHLTDKGQPLNTIENLDYMLGEYGITCAYNVISKDVEVRIPGSHQYDQDTEANAVLTEISSACARNRMPKADAQDFIKVLAARNRHNPVADFINSKPWDGKTRLLALCDTLKTPDGFCRDLMELLLRRWLISGAAAALSDRGFWSKGVLVLQGAQSEGKTSWVKALLPPDLRKLLKVGATIDPANKDSVSSAIGHWIVELGELDGTFRKADIARLKSFISQDIDQIRRPYDRLESSYQRRTVFFASVNPKVFLVDDTGNVRWWTIPVTAVNAAHDIDTQQLWAEMAHYYRQGERWWLERDEEHKLEAANKEHEEPNTLEELATARYDWGELQRPYKLSATEVLLALGYDRPNNRQAKDMGAVLRKLTGGEPFKSGGRSVFKMPPQFPQFQGSRAAGGDLGDDRPF